MPLRFKVTLLGLAFAAAALIRAAPLRVGIDVNGEPMTLIDAKGVPAGFAVDLMNGIAREMNFEVTYVAKPWGDVFEDFKAGRIDALANIAYTNERATVIDFAAPHLVLKGAIFVRKDDARLRTLADLRDLRIAIKLGGAPHEYLEAHSWVRNIVPAATLRDALHLVAESRADATVDTRIIGLMGIRLDALANVVASGVEPPEFAQRLHIGLHRDDVTRLALINEGLARLHTSGAYDRIYEKWIGPLEPRELHLKDVRPYLLPLAALVAAVLAALAWQRRLLQRLARQTEALRRSEEQLTLVIEGSEDGFWDWDLRTGRIARSERWAAMLGYTLAEIEPSPEFWRTLIHPDDRNAYEAHRREFDSGRNDRFHLECRMRTKSGEWRWILDRGKIVARAPDGTPLRKAGTHTDITLLKRAQEEMMRQEAQFRFIYEHAPVGLSWMHRHEAGTRLVNAAHERITGVPAAMCRNTANYVAASHPDDRDRQHQEEARLYRGEIEYFSMEKRYVHPDGRIVWAMLTMHLYRDPVTAEAQEVTTLVDITGLKHAEDERETLRLKMIDAQKLESLGVLAGGIAHDFNNLLTVVLANASLVRDDVSDTAGNDERLGQIEIAARRAADLCHQMLAYAGKGNFVIEAVELGDLVRDTMRLLEASISKKAQLRIELAPNLPFVEGDLSQLRQIVMNLLINASESLGDASGEIRVTTSLGRPAPTVGEVLHTFDLPAGETVCVAIADTGHGMDTVTLARIFDPFYTTKFAGRGLGLAAVLGIVRAHRGALAVSSSPGRGSLFRLYLPAVARSIAYTPEPPAPPVAERQGLGTLLIADDEPTVLAAADGLLRHHGYQTVLATDGLEALRLFRTDPPKFSAVLLDLTMPGLDGAEVLREIQVLHPTARVLVMSGFSEQDVLNRLRGLGPVAILHKPFTREMLLARLNELAAR